MADGIPPTGRSELEKIEEALKEEVEEWNALGMSMDGIGVPPNVVYIIKMQVQTLINVGLAKGYFTNDEFNLEFKKLILEDMQRLRIINEPQIRKARMQRIIKGDGDIAVPKFRLLGPNGEDLLI